MRALSTLIAVAGTGLAGAGLVQSAQAGEWSVGVGINVPGIVEVAPGPAYVYPPPLHYYAPTVYPPPYFYYRPPGDDGHWWRERYRHREDWHRHHRDWDHDRD